VAPVAHVDADCLGQARRLFEPRLDVAPLPGTDFRQGDDGGSAAGDIGFFAIEDAQLPRSAGCSSP
jgi:hypothetical protein